MKLNSIKMSHKNKESKNFLITIEKLSKKTCSTKAIKSRFIPLITNFSIT